MSGELAAELIRDLARAKDSLPAYDDTAVREIVDESIALSNKNREDISSTAMNQLIQDSADLNDVTPKERSTYTNVCLRAAGIERNKRCLIAYHMKRLEKIREIRWQGGPVIPDHLRSNLSASERTYSHKYNRALAKLMRGSGDLDFTQIQTPPKSLYVEVTCVEDVGDVELENGDRITLEKNSRYFLPRANVEPLVRQGLLKEIQRQV
ncbi:Oidioi.mRNA.OKI2018_I69.chr1.g1502.t1.cds [Oikopleura dioica]|uniref:DNA replication complex GINS protein PSF1 n=1 Tax=Oikopleura dioica TaxID=34765 RepID=A0ABN7SN49_OIKDI|nr:Oidioi.mRNA.OKI2018_I69.chr1.g1502.t1.cds [Oikopleura dioica]